MFSWYDYPTPSHMPKMLRDLNREHDTSCALRKERDTLRAQNNDLLADVMELRNEIDRLNALITPPITVVHGPALTHMARQD